MRSFRRPLSARTGRPFGFASRKLGSAVQVCEGRSFHRRCCGSRLETCKDARATRKGLDSSVENLVKSLVAGFSALCGLAVAGRASVLGRVSCLREKVELCVVPSTGTGTGTTKGKDYQ